MKRLQAYTEFSLLFLLLVMLFSGCAATEKRMEPTGAYAGQAELFVLDSAFDMAHSMLDTSFKYEKANRKALWQISPKIKHSIDKLRLEAVQVEKDYALARSIYQTNASYGASEMKSALEKLQSFSIATLTIIQDKGNQ